LRERLERPEPRIALGLRLRDVASAAIDLSDGLTGDLGHILERSNVGATIDLSALPGSQLLTSKLVGSERQLALACLLAGGDDYELCFCVPSAKRARIAAIATEADVPLTRIGEITMERGLVVRDERGAPLRDLPRAFDHFYR